jgi:hypothetical protein
MRDLHHPPGWLRRLQYQQTGTSNLLERVPQLCDNCGRRSVAPCGQASDYNVVAINAIQCIDIMINGQLWQLVVLRIQRQPRGDRLHLQWGDRYHRVIVMCELIRGLHCTSG